MGPIAAILGTLLLGTLAGWAGHWALHQRWTGRFYRAHATHHRLYPPGDLRSSSYRDARQDNTTFVLAPIVTFVLLTWIGALLWLGVSWYVYLILVVIGVTTGYAHDYLHEAFHLNHHWLDRFTWFQVLRELHWVHHRKVGKNIGVLWFGWDRLFGTFKRR